MGVLYSKLEEKVIQLSTKDAKKFIELVDSPPKPNDKLLKAVAAAKKIKRAII